ERLFTGFQLNVKGTTQHSGLHLIGTIVAEAGGSATDNDFERLAPIRVVNSVDISLFATNDEITLEYNDKIELKFIPDLSGLITSLEGLGEYIRNSTTVHIIDNDLLEINFEESDYSIKEGATMLSTPIRLQFRTNQNPFTVTLRPISVDVAESEKLGVFINSAAISSQSRATAVADFSDQPITVEVPANSQQYQIREFFIIEDDDVDEDMQSFAIVAEIGEDVAENISCFQLGVGSAECFGRQGATEIRITDNDPMIIGFAIKSQTISENEVPGMDIFPLLIEVGTLRTAEREHRIIFRHKESSSTATVEPLASYAKYDAIFGTREQPGDPLTEKFDLLPEHDTPLLSTFIRNDLHREEDECYTIQILPVDIPGRRELFKCNDSADADNYFCEHTICIVDDDELFVVAFERTTYMVDESVGSVNVCVNLTQPEIDILDETVNVFVIDDPSSVKIPAGATFATPDPPDFLERYTMVEKSDYAQQTNLFNAIDDVLITELKRIVCYNQTIYDDLRVEFDEYAGITLGVRDISTTAVKPMYDQASIFILDNDVAILGLEQTLFNVNENVGRVEVCAAVFSPDINCPVEFPFEVKLHTSDGTAVKMLDYEPLDVTLAFGVGEKRKCVHVNITNDTLVENDEFLTYHLRRTADLHTRIKLDPTLMDGQIKIEDDDTVLVQFIPTTYTVEEGRNDSATLTLVRSRNLRRKVNVTITPRVMTAAAEFDFRADQITITFSPGETEVKVHVSIFDDSFDEDTETFTAVLSTSDTYVQLGGNAIVSILDNDALITPNPSIYNVDEDDGNATLRLFRSGSISKESAVNITLISGTAEGGLDFVNTVITVTVLPGHAEAIAQSSYNR
ncbi:Extracellular matrix protein 3, partial [Geodia barretti]